MRSYPIADQEGRVVAFELPMAYISLATIARLLEAVPGTTEVRKRGLFVTCSEVDVQVQFSWNGERLVVCEPFGDNSRYWIGPRGDIGTIDLRKVQEVFERYEPPLWRRVIGGALTLEFRKRLLRR